jgi:hypothetical protein
MNLQNMLAHNLDIFMKYLDSHLKFLGIYVISM